jgi:RNA polymerase sigma-70 factor (ECF subfamily)
MDMLMDEEQQAIADCQMGKTESYCILVERYKLKVYYTALLYAGNRDDALDLSQEAFYRAFRSINSFTIGRNFYSWFYQILKNICINHFNRIKKRNVTFSDIEEKRGEVLFISPNAKPDEIFEDHEMREVLWNALNSLKHEDREIIILKEFNDFSYKEISEILVIPIGSVMSRLYYARKKLGKLLEDYK